MKLHYNTLWTVCLAACIALMFGACSDDDNNTTATPAVQTEWVTKTVAVVLPMDDGLDAHWHRTLELCAENLRKAFAESQKGIDLQFEWYDELAADMPQTAKRLAARSDVVAVIGGLNSAMAQTLANTLTKADKPLFTTATSEEFVRAYSSTGTVWAMTETDITQCEVLLSRAMYYGAKSVSLIAEGDLPYGKTFVDWIGFQAEELGLEVKDICSYSDGDPVEASNEAFASGADYIICVPSYAADLKLIVEARNAYVAAHGSAPAMLVSDSGYGTDVLAVLGGLAEGIEGVAYSANPESGFEVSYNVYFDDDLTLGEPQVYDAAMLIGYACYKQVLNPALDFTTAMRQVVDGRDSGFGSWMAGNMREVVQAYEYGYSPDVNGASGSLNFDAKVYTNVLSTVYSCYKVYNGRYIIVDYNTSDGSKRSGETLAGWNWKASQMQQTDTLAAEISYPDLKDHWALLVAASSGWTNYRHQADVFNMYQILKNNGYDDDHIVLIAEDDIATDENNLDPGVVRVIEGGDNVHYNVKVDYHTDALQPADIDSILCGAASDRLPEVIHADGGSNVLIFWSGHGKRGQLCWLDDDEGFSADLARRTFTDMSQRQCYRKVLCLIETCYSGSVMQEVVGLPGILALTAASPTETSKADNYSSRLGVWMSNRFTSTLHDNLTTNASISMRDLYYRLFLNTVGSHVMLYNDAAYGNLYTANMSEFVSGK
jgi:hypothetical protein